MLTCGQLNMAPMKAHGENGSKISRIFNLVIRRVWTTISNLLFTSVNKNSFAHQ
jgi:hypothetical protein